MTGSRRIRAVVLAAGRASRFGSNKLLAPFRGEALIRAALRATQKAFPGNVVLVTGHDASRVGDAAGDLADLTVQNPDYEQGLGSSIACGVEACREHADGIVILLADQPLVTAEHLHWLADAWPGTANDIVSSRYDGRLGVPAIFGSAHFDALCALEDDEGARTLLRSGRHAVIAVDCPVAGVDIDTREDLARCLSEGP